MGEGKEEKKGISCVFLAKRPTSRIQRSIGSGIVACRGATKNQTQSRPPVAVAAAAYRCDGRLAIH